MALEGGWTEANGLRATMHLGAKKHWIYSGLIKRAVPGYFLKSMRNQ